MNLVLWTGALSRWIRFGPAKGNVISTAHRDVLDNCVLPNLKQHFGQGSLMGVSTCFWLQSVHSATRKRQKYMLHLIEFCKTHVLISERSSFCIDWMPHCTHRQQRDLVYGKAFFFFFFTEVSLLAGKHNGDLSNIAQVMQGQNTTANSWRFVQWLGEA